MVQTTRRQTIVGAAAAALFSSTRLHARENAMPVKDLIIVNAKVTTLDRQNPVADAIAIRDGRFLLVGDEARGPCCCAGRGDHRR